MEEFIGRSDRVSVEARISGAGSRRGDFKLAGA
jgi:hypothetical protein